MSPFDPYLNWLGIPAHEQPPHFYRLLGIVLFESNPQVIEQAADRQSLAVGAYQAGPQGELCQRLLGEIAMARHNLLDPQQKAGYDAYLQQILAHRGERAVAAPPPPSIIGAAAPRAIAPAGIPPPVMQRPGHSPQPPMPAPMPQGAMPQPAMLLPPLPQPPPGPPMMSPPMPQPQFRGPSHFPTAASYPTAMPVQPARPAVVPVAAPFPVAARAASNGAVATPAAPPAIPPAAPLRPMDELERLTAQPTRRRRFIKKKKSQDHSKEILIGVFAAAAVVALIIIFVATHGPGDTGPGDNVSGNGGGASHAPRSQKEAAEKPKQEKKTAAVAPAPHKDDLPRRPPGSPAPLRKGPAPANEDNFQDIPAASPAPAPPNRKDIDSPQRLRRTGRPGDGQAGRTVVANKRQLRIAGSHFSICNSQFSIYSP